MAIPTVSISHEDLGRLITYFIVPFLALLFFHRWYNDPLRPVPGPFLAKYTGLWIILVELSGRRGTTIHELHKRYGPAVRVAPQEVCFCSVDALNEIYSANSKYTKSPVYESFAFQGAFNMRDQQQYRVMKKRLNPSFSPSATAALEPVVHRQIRNLIKCLDKRLGEPLDVVPWLRMLALGVVGELFIGDSFSGLETEKTPNLLHEIDNVIPTLWVWWMFPVLSTILQYVPIPGIQNFLKAANDFRKYCTVHYNKYLASRNQGERNDFIARMVNERNDLTAKLQAIPRHLTEDGIIDEMTNMIFAGTDTIGNTLVYLFWELANYPKWQLKLRQELARVTDHDPTPRYDGIIDLPVLDAVLQETFRVHPAGFSGLRRLTPNCGAVISGVSVPAGTTVSCQAFSQQREPSIFPEPDSFNPQRWLDAGKSSTADMMRSQLMLFGKGQRACLGQRMAIMEAKCCIAALIRRFDFAIGSPRTNADMEMTDHFLIVPKGRRCVLNVTKVQCSTIEGC